MSLPHLLGTTLENVPSGVPYIADSDWPKIEVPPATGKRIAIVWAGSPRHGKDLARSMTPEDFQPIVDSRPDFQFYSLQLGPREGEFSRLRNVTDLAPIVGVTKDWTGTAQALQQIDLLICVDTGTLHLAGALARPAWAFIPRAADWRWMTSGESSPWYPTLKLFRQEKAGEWQNPITRVVEALKDL